MADSRLPSIGGGVTLRLARALLVGVATLALTAGVAGATHSDGTGPKDDFVNGTGNFEGPLGTLDFLFHVNAKGGPSGEDPDGALWIKGVTALGEVNFQGSVTCLRVTGNRADVGGRVERSRTAAAVEGQGFIFEFVDNGEPGSNPDQNAPDTFNGALLPLPPAICDFTDLAPINRGNFVVHDAAP